jgi:16S rRNA (guanine527-N7)-methyltransferase
LDLGERSAYAEYGLDESAQRRLAVLGDLLLGAGFNVTGVRDPWDIERVHFLDSLSLLRVGSVPLANRLADIGSGGGLPALVLALVLPGADVTAIESHGKKCEFIARAAETLGLGNVSVCHLRAEDHARLVGRAAYDVVVSRAVAALPVIAEYSLPLLRLGGEMVAMKGLVSDQERIQASGALDILGADALEAIKMDPFAGSTNRWVYLAKKVRVTPADFPRRAGVPAKRPLGERRTGQTTEEEWL